jgi:ankyrin repeat protein
MTEEQPPEGYTYRMYYESFVYDAFIKHHGWNKDTCLHMINDDVFLQKHVINTVDNEKKTLLNWLCRQRIGNYEEHIQKLIDRGADVNLQDDYYNTPLLWAADDESLTDILLKAGADVSLNNTDGATALFAAVNIGYASIVKKLMEAGSKTVLDNNEFWLITPLMSAIEKQYIEIVKILVSYGPDLNLRDFDGNTALMQAVNKRDVVIVKILLEAGADVHIRNSQNQTAHDLANLPVDSFWGEDGVSKNREIVQLLQQYM